MSLLALHGVTGWLIVLIGGWTLHRTLGGWRERRTFQSADRAWLVIFTLLLHLQALLGQLGYMLDAQTPLLNVPHLLLGGVAVICSAAANILSQGQLHDQSKFARAALGTSATLIFSMLAWAAR